MIKPITFQGTENFNANLYALEVASRFLDHTAANGYYKDYGSELAATADGTTVTIGTGALVVQGRMVEISEAETVELESPVNGNVGYICMRIETYHPSDTENCSLVIYSGSSYSAVEAELTKDDVYASDSNGKNIVYECPIYSFAVANSKITSLTLVLDAVSSAVEIATEAKEAAESAVDTATTASEDVQALSEQVGENLGTTIYKNGVALASINFDKIANSDDTNNDDGLYEHRIYLNATRTLNDNTYWWRLEFTFINNISTPYLTSDMTTTDLLASGLKNVFNAIEDIATEGDYLNSSAHTRTVPCRGFSKTNDTVNAVYVAFNPSATFYAGSYFMLYMISVSAAAAAVLVSASFYYNTSNYTIIAEDNVRQLTIGTPSGDGSVEVSTETDDDGNVYLVMGV